MTAKSFWGPVACAPRINIQKLLYTIVLFLKNYNKNIPKSRKFRTDRLHAPRFLISCFSLRFVVVVRKETLFQEGEANMADLFLESNFQGPFNRQLLQ